MKFILGYRTELFIIFLVPIHPLRWYRFLRYSGTGSSAMMVPIRALRWYRLTDTINDETNFNSISHSSPIPLERYPDIKYCIGIRILHISENQMYYNENPVVVEYFSPNDRQ